MTALVGWLGASIPFTALTVAVLATLAVAIGRWFELSVAGSLAVYFVVWWIVLFAVLPVRVSSQAELGDIAHGTEPGAPAAPALRERAIWTSIAATAVFAAAVALFPLAGL